VVRSPAGRLGNLWEMRRSAPSTLAERRMAELALPSASWQSGAAGAATSAELRREPHRDVRVRRARRAADISTSSCGGGFSCARASSCVGGILAEDGRAKETTSSVATAGANLSEPSSSTAQAARGGHPAARGDLRCASLPPTGTTKADDNATMTAKSRAVAALQRLFFEEMAKGGQDASGAAAAALRRLTEVPMTEAPQSEATSVVVANTAVSASSYTVTHEEPATPRDIGQNDAAEEPLLQQVAALNARPVVPRRPSSVDVRRRRPVGCVRSRVPVQG
jgi:hypothetical protein